MFGPRNRPTSNHSRPPVARPPAGSSSRRVEPPPGPPEPRRGHQELQARDLAARLDHAGQLAERGLRVEHVPEQVGKGQRVEGGVGERQLLGAPGRQPDAVAQPRVRDVALALSQHLLGEIDPDHTRPGPCRDLERDAGRPRRDVKHGLARGRRYPADHGTAPAAVLPEREDLGQLVVPLRKRSEQVLREAVALGGGGVLWAAGSGTTSPQCWPGGDPRNPRASARGSRNFTVRLCCRCCEALSPKSRSLNRPRGQAQEAGCRGTAARRQPGRAGWPEAAALTIL